MCLPVIRYLRSVAPDCEVLIVALTTAFAVARQVGESPLGYRNFLDGVDSARALNYGRQLLTAPTHPQVSVEESLAYLGYNFLEWVDTIGEANAWDRWRKLGRQGFFPIRFFTRVLRQLQPDVLVTTNSPRSEQAAIEAACSLGIPSLSMVDLFALPGDPFLRRSVHATCVTVLTETVREQLIMAGLDGRRIIVTGNPAFDSMMLAKSVEAGQQWRVARRWASDAKVTLWAGHKEPADAEPRKWSNTGLGEVVQERLLAWMRRDDRVHLAIRYHPNEWHEFPKPTAHPRLHWSQPDKETLLPPLMGSDVVIVQASTVGAQAHAAGKRLLSLSYSPLVIRSGMDYARFGIAEAISSPEALETALDRDSVTTGSSQSDVRIQAAPAISRLVMQLAGRIL